MFDQFLEQLEQESQISTSLCYSIALNLFLYREIHLDYCQPRICTVKNNPVNDKFDSNLDEYDIYICIGGHRFPVKLL